MNKGNPMRAIFTVCVVLCMIVSGLVSSQGFAQTVWEKDPTNPVIEPGAAGSWDEAGVLALGMYFDGVTFYMWYSGFDAEGNDCIGYATSADGIDWTKHSSNPLLCAGEAGSWDEVGVGSPSVIVGGVFFHMWFDATGADNSTGIGYATSVDGITWTKQGTGPVLAPGNAGEWDAGAVLNPMVIAEEGGFRMWYAGWDGTNTRIGTATSQDGVVWTKDAANPVLDVGPAGAWDEAYVLAPTVLADDGVYRMWYEGSARGENSPFPDGGSIGYAESTDGGVTWQKHNGNPVLLPGAEGSWDDYTIFPEVLKVGESYRMWYSGQNETSSLWQIGYAESSATSTGVEDKTASTARARIVSASPNPLSASTHIDYDLSGAGHVEIVVYNSLGQWVQTLENAWQAPGRYRATWHGLDSSGRPMGGGVYTIVLRIGANAYTYPLVLLR